MTTPDPPAPQPHLSRCRGITAAALCALLLALHALLAWTAVSNDCATYDEPLHTVAAFTHLRLADFRADTDNPVLFKYWAALPQPGNALDLTRDPTDWQRTLRDPRAIDPVVRKVLYDFPPADGQRPTANAQRPTANGPVDADAAINRSRAMMLLLSLALGAVLAVTAWKLAGPVAAIIATTLYALDPNFLAHGPLVKNDVPFALAFFLLTLSLHQLGRRITPWTVLAAAATAAACLTTKFTGLLVLPLIPLMLFTRALLPTPWTIALYPRRTSAPPSSILHPPSSPHPSSLIAHPYVHRFLTATALSALVLLLSYAGVWSVYRFRFSPTLDPAERLSYDHVRTKLAVAQLMQESNGSFPTNEQVAARTRAPDLPTRLTLFADAHHLLPQPWLYGFLLTRASVTVRYGFLLNHKSLTGWWYYFPLAILFKTPTATLLAILLAALLLARQALRHAAEKRSSYPSGAPPRVSNHNAFWTPLALTLPAALFLASALTAHLNIGLRHILPLYPFLYLLTATTLAPRRSSPSPSSFIVHRSSFIVSSLALLLAAETLPAFPHFIPFFNLPSRLYGPLKLLSDSNLDWGQDLKRLVDWQHTHENTPLYLCYYGSVPPEYYGLRFTPLPGNMPLPGPDFPPGPPGVLAISATHLQAVYFNADLTTAYAPLRSRTPITKLGTIYLYSYP